MKMKNMKTFEQYSEEILEKKKASPAQKAARANFMEMINKKKANKKETCTDCEKEGKKKK